MKKKKNNIESNSKEDNQKLKKAQKNVSTRIKVFVLIIFIGFVFSIISAYIFYTQILQGLPNPSGLKNYNVIPLSTKIYDRNNILLYEIFKNENRSRINIKDLPIYILQATIAIEDATFYKHSGISIIGGMVRAFKDTVILKKGLQGGSTITQQLVKSALLSPERTIKRKIKEIILAIWTEQLLSKDEILEAYLNQVPYGGVSYGIQQASRTYFAKDAKDLTLAQAALLAGLPRAPSAYSPFENYTKAKLRQEEVLKRMLELKFITKKQYESAKSEKLIIHPPKQSIKAPHFVFFVKKILENEYGKELVSEGGLKVITSLDMNLQASAEASIYNEVDKLKKLKVNNGAALITRPATGEILSMVGSKDFFATSSGSFNVVTAHRQPGSSIKPINYAIGIDRKIVAPHTVFLDVPTCFNAPGQPKSYCPVNYDNTYHGPVQLRFALGSSYNIPAVKMLALNGVENFIASSSAFLFNSFKNPKRYGLSLTLGGGEVTMIEMAQAFSAFANEGIPKHITSILKIEDKNGKTIYEYKDKNFKKNIINNLSYPNFLAIEGRRAISKETAYLISHILLDNNARSAAFGSQSQLVIKNKAVSVKTGTTNDLKDNWTIGYTPNFLVAVWVGNNDNSSMSYLASGITGAAPIWNAIMTEVLKNQKDLWPRKPEDVVGKEICFTPQVNDQSNDPATETTQCSRRFEFHILGTENLNGVYIKKEFVPISKDTGAMVKEDYPNMELQEKNMLYDMVHTRYCMDCVHDKDPYEIVNILPEINQKNTLPNSN